MRKFLFIGALCSMTIAPSAAMCWWDNGHMQVAAFAYYRLKPAVRVKVDALIKLNPQYASWTAGWQPNRAAFYAFIRAATWADDIKGSELGYTDTGDKAENPEASRNIGYTDVLKHGYWHFKDIGFSTDGTPVEEPDAVNAATQLKTLIAGLSPTSGLPDDVRSYDLVWLLHLIGDVHQPLHAAARFSQAHRKGDQGGNLVEVIPATGLKMKLHAYWDSQLGSYSTPQGAVMDALISNDTKLPEPDATEANKLNPDDWLVDSHKVAKEAVYAEPVKSGTEPVILDRAYETNARTISRQQAALAGARLANLLNDVLK